MRLFPRWKLGADEILDVTRWRASGDQGWEDAIDRVYTVALARNVRWSGRYLMLDHYYALRHHAQGS